MRFLESPILTPMASPWFSSNGPLWLTAGVSGLIMMMLVAVVAPRLFGTDGVSWIVSLAAGVIIALGIVFWGYTQRKAGTVTEGSPTSDRGPEGGPSAGV